MKLLHSLHAEPAEAVPVVKMSGQAADVPLIEFGEGMTVFLGQLGDQLPAWLRALAGNLTAFADQLDAEASYAEPPVTPPTEHLDTVGADS